MIRLKVKLVFIGEGLHPSDFTTKNEGVDIVCSFVSVDRFQVDHVSDDVVLVLDAVSAKHVTRRSRDFQRRLTIFTF